MQEPLHQRHLADDQLHQSDNPESESEPQDQDQDQHASNRPSQDRPQSLYSAPSESASSDGEEDASQEPPPSYEQSISAPSASGSSSSRANPFLDRSGRPTQRTAQATGSHLQYLEETSAPRLAPRHAPSAPPLTLLTSTSSAEQRNESGPSARHTRDGQVSSSSSSTSASRIRRGKRPVRNHQSDLGVYEDEAEQSFRSQSAMSPSYLHSSAAQSSSPAAQDGYFLQQQGYNSSSSSKQSRTSRRLQHKQDFARHAATAPELYPQHAPLQNSTFASQPSLVPPQATPMLSLSQSVIPAPPPRLLQFRSREPSSVPACPFLLCQKPIAFTKTRHERGVTVWIVCGLLFLCNTYWTAHVLIDHFSSSNRDRVLSKGTADASMAASSGFTATSEAGHLMKGFLGFKTYRSKEPTFRNYQRHQSAMQRPTIATVGIVQDEQSALQMVLSFCMLALMAILRWWLCLTPLLIRPLFDTVHSCPHAHPYPFPEEIEEERRMVEEAEGRLEDQQQPDGQSLSSNNDCYYGDEKKRLRNQDEEGEKTKDRSRRRDRKQSEMTENGSKPQPTPTPTKGTKGQNTSTASTTDETTTAATKTNTNSDTTADDTTGAMADGFEYAESTAAASEPPKSRFRFFQRIRAIRQQRQQEGRQAIAETVTKIQRKKLSWKMRRLLAKAQARREAVIKASQDIGRYSLLYGLGAIFMADRWKQAVLSPGELQAEAYED